MICDLKSVNSTDREDFLYDHDLEGPNLRIEFEPFAITHSEDAISADDLSTSSFVKDIISTSSRKMNAKSNEMLTSAAEN